MIKKWLSMKNYSNKYTGFRKNKSKWGQGLAKEAKGLFKKDLTSINK